MFVLCRTHHYALHLEYGRKDYRALLQFTRKFIGIPEKPKKPKVRVRQPKQTKKPKEVKKMEAPTEYLGVGFIERTASKRKWRQ